MKKHNIKNKRERERERERRRRRMILMEERESMTRSLWRGKSQC